MNFGLEVNPTGMKVSQIRIHCFSLKVNMEYVLSQEATKFYTCISFVRNHLQCDGLDLIKIKHMSIAKAALCSYSMTQAKHTSIIISNYHKPLLIQDVQ